MYPIPFIIPPSLVAATVAQTPTSTIESLPGFFEPEEFQTTITLPGPSGTGTVFNCFFESEGESDVEKVEIECSSIGQVALTTSLISSRISAQPPNPMRVLERRMQRKFGVKARQESTLGQGAFDFGVSTTTIQPDSCGSCSTVTFTSTAYAGNNTDLCSPIPTPPSVNKGALPPFPVPAAQLTAMSIVADMLSNEVSAEASAQSAANLIPAILSALTANVTSPTAGAAYPARNISASNATVVAPTLGATASSAILSPPPSQAKSIGTSTAVGILANLVAAAGIAYLLV